MDSRDNQTEYIVGHGATWEAECEEAEKVDLQEQDEFEYMEEEDKTGLEENEPEIQYEDETTNGTLAYRKLNELGKRLQELKIVCLGDKWWTLLEKKTEEKDQEKNQGEEKKKEKEEARKQKICQEIRKKLLANSEYCNLESEVFLLLLQYFPQYTQCMGEFFAARWMNFGRPAHRKSDKKKLIVQNLENFAKYGLKSTEKEVYRKDRDVYRGTVKQQPEESTEQSAMEGKERGKKDKRIREWRYAKSLDVMSDGHETCAPMGIEEQLEMEETMFELMSLILKLPEKLNGKKNNPRKINYYRMFFTDNVVGVASHIGKEARLEFHEKELFCALHLAFLDFFRDSVCRTVHQIYQSKNKTYQELVSTKDAVELHNPLPNDIYCAFMKAQTGKTVGEPAISNQRTAYKKFVAKIFGTEQPC